MKKLLLICMLLANSNSLFGDEFVCTCFAAHDEPKKDSYGNHEKDASGNLLYKFKQGDCIHRSLENLDIWRATKTRGNACREFCERKAHTSYYTEIDPGVCNNQQ